MTARAAAEGWPNRRRNGVAHGRVNGYEGCGLRAT